MFILTVPVLSAFSVAAIVGIVAAFFYTRQMSGKRRDAEESAYRQHCLAEASGEAIILLKDGKIYDANDIFRGLLSCSLTELTLDGLHAMFTETCRPLLKEALKHEDTVFERMTITDKEGTEILVDAAFRRIRSAQGEIQAVSLRDRREAAAAEETIAFLSNYDPLTKLINRQAFAARLTDRITDDQSPDGMAVMVVDVDGFRNINETLGAGGGDEYLRRVAAAVAAALDVHDEAARLGADQFGLIQHGGDQPLSALRLAQAVQSHLSEPMTIEGRLIQTTVSIGVALYPENGRDTALLLANAETALLRAKRRGGNVVQFFEANLDEQVKERRSLEIDLKAADVNSDIVLHFQPLARADNRQLVSFETLIRWRHKDRGMIPPGLFIPIAEDSGKIIEIGANVIERATREAARWRVPLSVAINLSPLQFLTGDLVKLVHEALLKSTLPAHRLELEVTESVLMDDADRSLEMMKRLKELGVILVLDDFGTGFSSLNYLHRFPFDKLKIDRSFVMDVDKDNQSAAIVRAVIALAHSLDIPVVAEGVETEAQLAILQEQKCDLIQGWLIGRPNPIADYAEQVGLGETFSA